MKRRIFSILTALALCLSLLPTAAWAAEPDEAPDTSAWTVTAFDDLAADVANQTLPQLAEGGEAQGPNLPDTLAATAHQGDGEPQSVDIAVTWEADSTFDQTAPGKYIYTPVLPDGYALAEGVEPPTITVVTVEAAPDPQDEPDTQAETPTVVDVPVAHTAGDATTGVWDGQTDISWYTDTETTFTLKTAAELAGLAKLVNEGVDNSGPVTFSGVTITLGAAIDLSGKDWTPIGNSDNTKFQGTFDGNGHTVSGLRVNIISIQDKTSVYAGLFGYVGDKRTSGTVKNLNVIGEINASTVTSYSYTGGVVGYLKSGTVENCTYAGEVTGAMTEMNASNSAVFVGGVVGYVDSNGKVTGCLNSGTVSGIALLSRAGGVVGYTNGGVTVENCGNTGPVKLTSDNPNASGGATVGGGIVGENEGAVKNCFSTGEVTGTVTGLIYGLKIGGIAGRNYNSVTNCYFLQDTGTNESLSGIGSSSSNNGAGAKMPTLSPAARWRGC